MQYLTINKAASALSVSVNTLRRMLPLLGAVDIKKGAGKNRQIRIPVEGIERYLSGCEIHGADIDPGAKPNVPLRLERRRA